MAWQPNSSSSTDTTVVHQNLEKQWSQAKAIIVTRRANTRDPLAELGTYVIDDKDNPRSVVDTVAELCKSDAESLGGEQRYEIKVSVIMQKANATLIKKGKSPTTPVEEIRVLGTLKFGTSDGGAGQIGSILREATGLIKGMGEAQDRHAEADQKRMATMHQGFDLQAKFMESMSQALENMSNSSNSVNANAVKALELTLADNREQRQEARDDAKARLDMEFEDKQNERAFGALRQVGQAAKPWLNMLIPVFAYKIRVETEVKAKTHGVNVDPPEQPTAEEEPKVTVTQDEPVTKVRDEVADFVDNMLTVKEREKFSKALQEDAWSVLVAATKAPDDYQCQILLRQFALAVMQLDENARVQAMVLIEGWNAAKKERIMAIFTAAGIKFGS